MSEEQKIVSFEDRRLWSLDALRGLDMLLITGLPALIGAVVGGVCGHWDAWIIKTMAHAKWEGFNVMDTVFPLFMFMSGVAWPYSYARMVEKGIPRKRILLKIAWRTLALVALGIVYNGFFTNVFAKGFVGCRYPSVLARIGLAWGGAALLYVFFRWRTRVAIAVSILVGYWAACAFIVAPGAPAGCSPWTHSGSITFWLDRQILPGGGSDPEGFLSTFPAIVTTMGGVFVGAFVRSDRWSAWKKVLAMILASALCGVAAWGWSRWCPIIKVLWTSTFVLAAWSWSLAWFAIFYGIIDGLKFRKWTLFFRVIGMNSILVYFLRILFDFHKPANFFFHGLAQKVGAPWGGVIDAVAFILAVWVVLFVCYRKKVFLRV